MIEQPLMDTDIFRNRIISVHQCRSVVESLFSRFLRDALFSKLLVLVLVTLSQVNPLYAEGTLEQVQETIASIENQLEHLPKLYPGESGGSIGYLSGRMVPPVHITIRLRESTPIDEIVLVPTRLKGLSGDLETHGWPTHITIKGANEEDFSDAKIIAQIKSDYSPAHQGYPMSIAVDGSSYNFIKVICNKRSRFKDFLSFSLAEIYVFSRNQNVAAKRPVHSDGNRPWARLFNRRFLTDGQTTYGLPESRFEKHPQVRGWHAKTSKTQEINEWVELRFPEPISIQQLVLYPVYHTTWPNSTAYGFPQKFAIEMTTSDGSSRKIVDFLNNPFPPPGNNPVVFSKQFSEVTKLRILATQASDDIVFTYPFALAEWEVYSDGINVAPQATIHSSSLHLGPHNDWAENAMTDGLTSLGKILPLREWLNQLALRGQLELELVALNEQQNTLISLRSQRQQTLILTLSLLLSTAFFLTLYLILRRQRALAKTRHQIASDLHDDIGSNLASIALLNEHYVDSKPEASPVAKAAQIARETANAMNDIVWMLHPDRKAATNLYIKLKDISDRLLVDIPHNIRNGVPDLDKRVPEEKFRDLIYVFKESLHNLARHSNAIEVNIQLVQERTSIVIIIADNGKSIDPEKLPVSLTDRCKKMHAKLHYTPKSKHKPFNRMEIAVPTKRLWL